MGLSAGCLTVSKDGDIVAIQGLTDHVLEVVFKDLRSRHGVVVDTIKGEELAGDCLSDLMGIQNPQHLVSFINLLSLGAFWINRLEPD